MKLKDTPCEVWLSRGATHEQWAAAMNMCKSSQAVCGADGYCHYYGDCFKKCDIQARIEALENELAQLKADYNRNSEAG